MLTPEQLNSFCREDFRIECPWSAGDWTYATNGYLIVRVCRIEEIRENPKAPRVTHLFPEERPDPKEFLPIPQLPIPIYGPILYGPTLDDDFQKEEIFVVMEIRGVPFWVALLRKLIWLPDCKIAPVDQNKPAWFKFTGGCGRLMPCRQI